MFDAVSIVAPTLPEAANIPVLASVHAAFVREGNRCGCAKCASRSARSSTSTRIAPGSTVDFEPGSEVVVPESTPPACTTSSFDPIVEGLTLFADRNASRHPAFA